MARFLVTADVHLGRASSRVEGDGHSAGAAWERICRLARREAVDAVLVAGDLVDAESDYPHALGAVLRGMRLLAGTPVLAVSGNHDAWALPRLAEEVEGLVVMGLDGAEGRWTLEEVAGATVAGWSFPRPRRAHEQAEVGPNAAFAEGPPRADVGLLHADVGAGGSRYHALSPTRLAGTGVRRWYLGHVHTHAAPGGSWRYCSSPQALDPGETGDHGVWLLDTVRNEETFHETSTVRYRTLAVSAEDAPDAEEVAARIARAVEEAATGGHVLVPRVALHGRTSVPRASLDALRGRPYAARLDGFDASGLRPALDLEARAAEGKTPAGLLASLLLSLDGEGDPPAELAGIPPERLRSVAARLLEATLS